MTVLTQTSHDLPDLHLKRTRVACKEDCLKRQAAKATQELLDLDKLIARREAHADAALVAIKAADEKQPQQQQHRQQHGLQTSSMKGPKAPQDKRVTSVTRPPSTRSRSPLAPGLVRMEAKQQKMAIWPPGAKKR